LDLLWASLCKCRPSLSRNKQCLFRLSYCLGAALPHTKGASWVLIKIGYLCLSWQLSLQLRAC
jgi:hypothetical protein